MAENTLRTNRAKSANDMTALHNSVKILDNKIAGMRIDNADILSSTAYSTVLSNIARFRTSGGQLSDELGKTDVPAWSYFKIFFYFDNQRNDGPNCNFLSLDYDRTLINRPWNPDVENYTEYFDDAGNQISQEEYEEHLDNIIDDLTNETGSWDWGHVHMRNDYNTVTKTREKKLEENYIPVNSAYNYLLINQDYERAEKLEKFITLLSNISVFSPWYFSEVTGIGDALERKYFEEEAFKIEDARKKISIKCLPDAFDNRIGALLDLYRDVTRSQIWKKEIIPANLRKFDMGIFIFSNPIANFYGTLSPDKKSADYGRMLKNEEDKYKMNSKYIEFRNCEISYNSSKTGFDALNNKEGTQQEYTIDIFFDDAYEMRYNEFLQRTIGDWVEWDMAKYSDSISTTYQIDEDKTFVGLTARKSSISMPVEQEESSLLKKNSVLAQAAKKVVENNINAVIAAGTNAITSTAKKLALGNLFTIHPTGVIDTVRSLSKGAFAGRLSQSALNPIASGNMSNLVNTNGWNKKFSGYKKTVTDAFSRIQTI